MLNWIGTLSAIGAFAMFGVLVWHALGKLAQHWRTSRLMALGILLCLGWWLS